MSFEPWPFRNDLFIQNSTEKVIGANNTRMTQAIKTALKHMRIL
jgi:hypothetical protein